MRVEKSIREEMRNQIHFHLRESVHQITPVETSKLNYEIELAFHGKNHEMYIGHKNLFSRLSNTEQTEVTEKSLTSIDLYIIITIQCLLFRKE